MFHVEQSKNNATRQEHDLLGEMNLPVDAYYGIHTQRAKANFTISGSLAHPRLIAALALVKQAAAETNMELGLLDKQVGEAISLAASEVATGKFADQFIVDALQGGAGTSTAAGWLAGFALGVRTVRKELTISGDHWTWVSDS